MTDLSTYQKKKKKGQSFQLGHYITSQLLNTGNYYLNNSVPLILLILNLQNCPSLGIFLHFQM